MGTTKPGGFFYKNGVAVNANGDAIEGAPPQPEPTPTQQLAAPKTPAQEMGEAIAAALRGSAVAAPAPAADPKDKK